jgi:ribonuclease HI
VLAVLDAQQSIPGLAHSDDNVSNIAEIQTTHIVMAFDGGARISPTHSAHACCMWSDSGSILWWADCAARPGGTNNEMKAHTLRLGLKWLNQHWRHIPIWIIGDLAIIVSMAL